MFENNLATTDLGLSDLLELLRAAVGADGVVVMAGGVADESAVLASAPVGIAGRRLRSSPGLLAVCGKGVQATDELLLSSAMTGWLGFRPGFVSAAKIEWDGGEGCQFFWWKERPDETASERVLKSSGLVSRFAAQEAMAVALLQIQGKLETMMEKVSHGMVFVDSLRGSQLNQVAANILGLPVSTTDTAAVVAAMQQMKSQCSVESPEALPSPFGSALMNSSAAEYWICDDRDLALRVESHSVGNAQTPGRFWVFSDVKPLWESTQKLRSANDALGQNVVQLAEEVVRRTAAEATLRRYNLGLQQQNEVLEIANIENELLANNDALTGLANRRGFRRKLESMLEDARDHRRQVAVFYLDLDKFKQVNDTLGHERGDQLLREVTMILVNKLRKDDLVGRLGGDEFICALSISSGTTVSMVIDLAADLCQELKIPVEAGSETIHVSASIGVAIYPDDAEDVTGLLTAADNAMYAGKRQGGNEMIVFARSRS